MYHIKIIKRINEGNKNEFALKITGKSVFALFFILNCQLKE